MPGAKNTNPDPVRLTDITTQEVSLVDKAANKRKWVMRKAAGTEVKPDGSGGFVPVETPAVTPAVVETVVTTLALSKATKGAIQSTIEKLTTLLASPDAEADADGSLGALTKALEAFEPAPVLHAGVDAALKQPVAFAKAATGCAMKLLEIAQSLSLDVDESDANEYPYSLRYKISDVLEALLVLSSLERMEPAAAAMVAAAVSKADVPAPADAVAQSRLKNVALVLQKALYSGLHTSEDTGVKTFDSAAMEKLLEGASTLIKSLKGRVEALEARPAPSNALSPEVETVTKSDQTVWANDLAAEVDAEERAPRK